MDDISATRDGMTPPVRRHAFTSECGIQQGVVRGEYNVLRAGADPGEIMLQN